MVLDGAVRRIRQGSVKMTTTLELAQQMANAAYEVSKTITNKEWHLSRGEDYESILAEKKAAYDLTKAAYVAAKRANG